MVRFGGVSSKDTFILLYIFLLQQRFANGVKITTESNNKIVLNGTKLELEWTVNLSPGDIILSRNVHLVPDFNNPIILGTTVEPKGQELFGENRLSATFADPKYTMTLKDVKYNESGTFRFSVVFQNNGLNATVSEIRVVVTGSPETCGKSLKPAYNITETVSLTVTQDICGHPKPYVEWKLEENSTFSSSFGSMLINDASKKYRYSYTTQNIVRSHCGKTIMYNARNEFGNVKGNSTIYISFKPSKITLTSSYRHNASCVYLTWRKEDTGNCLMDYYLKFDDKDDVYITFKTNFSLCHSPCASSASVWASYKGNAGYKIGIMLHSIPSRLDTTIMPSSRTTTEGPAAQIEDDCKCASKSAISIVVTIVIGLILNIVIFVILKHKGFIIFTKNPKKTLQHTERRDDDNYEVTETTSSHYTDLNVKSVKPSIYADLTSDSSKEYAEIELNETKANMYANINT